MGGKEFIEIFDSIRCAWNEREQIDACKLDS